MARCAVNTIRFLSHHPRRWASVEQIPDSEARFLWKLSIKLLEQENMLQSNPQLKQFSWHASYFQQWHAFIHVLDTLRANPLIEDTDKAWKLIESTYENIPEMATDMRKPIHIAVGNLCLKAYNKLEATSQDSNLVPHYIIQLRERLEVLKSKRKVQESNVSRLDAKGRDTKGNTSWQKLNTGVMNPGRTSDPVPDPETVTPQVSGFTRVAYHTATSEADTSWFATGFDNNVGNGNSELSAGLDFVLDQDCFMGNSTVDWDQWDHWLAGSNLMDPPLSVESLRESDIL